MTDQSTAITLHEKLAYNVMTGVFTWRVRCGSRGSVDAVAGYIKDGYRLIKFQERDVRAHHLAWMYCYGYWPTGQLDHINGRRDDNRLENLRDVTSAINNQNRRVAHKNNKLGILGVYEYGNGFAADIRINGRNVHIGCFATSDEASSAYVRAKRKSHPGCTI